MKKFLDRYLFSRLGLQILFSVIVILLFSFLGTKLRTVVTNHKEADVYSQTFWGFRQITDGGSMAGTLDELDTVAEESGNSYGAPVVLTIALVSWLIGMVLYSFVTGAVVNAFEGRKDKIEGGKARYRFKDHGIVIGWDFQGVAAVMALLDTWQLKEVLVVSEKPSEEIRAELENELDEKSMRKVYVYNGTLATPESVEELYPDKARAIIVLGDRNDFDNDGGNLRIGTILRQHVSTTVRLPGQPPKLQLKTPRPADAPPLQIFIEISNPYNLSLAEKYPTEGYGMPEGMEVHIVNFCKATVRGLYSSFSQFVEWNSGRRTGVYETPYMPLAFRRNVEATHAHLVLSGVGDMAKAMALETAPLLGGGVADGRITVFSDDEEELARFEAAFPFDRLVGVKVDFVPHGIDSAESRGLLAQIVRDETASVTICITNECADEAFATANRLPPEVRFENVRLLVEQRILSKWAHKTYPLQMTGFKDVAFFGFIDRHFSSIGQKVAFAEKLLAGEKFSGSLARFFALSFPDGLLENLSSHGYRFEYNPGRERKAVVAIPKDERVAFARFEHARNVNAMLLNGMSAGSDDDVFKTSSSILPWDALDATRREAYAEKIDRALCALEELYNCGEYPYIVEADSFREILGVLPDENVRESSDERRKLRNGTVNPAIRASKLYLPDGTAKTAASLAVALTPGKGLSRQVYRLAFLEAIPMIVVLPCGKDAFLEAVPEEEREFYARWLRNAHKVVTAKGSVEETIRAVSRNIFS